MDIRQLRYFVGVSEAGSLTQAADRLHVAQPALSQQLLKLERALGQKLMLRHSRGVSLTEAGARLLDHARYILAQVDRAQTDIADLGAQPSGLVRVGMPRSASDLFGIEVLVRARRLYPRLRIAVIDRVSEELTELLARNELDLCLTFARPEQEMVESTPLYNENLCLALPRRLPVGGMRGVRSTRGEGGWGVPSLPFGRLAQLPLALPTVGHGLRTLVDQTAAALGLRLDVRFELDSVQLLRDAVARNLACTILPWSSLLEQARSGSARVCRIIDPPVARVLHLVRSTRRPASKAVLAVSEVLAHAAGARLAAPEYAGYYEPTGYEPTVARAT